MGNRGWGAALFAAACAALPAAAQTDPADLASLHARLRSAPSASERLAFHDSLLARWPEALTSGIGFSDQIAAIPGIGVVDAGSGSERLRIIGWNVELDDRTHRYGCFVLHASEKDPAGYAWEARTVPRRAPVWDTTTRYRENEYPGALFYSATLVHDGRKPVYLVLGWDGADGTLNRKIAETWEPSREGMRYGTSRIDVQGLRTRRLVLSYREDVTAMLRWEGPARRVVMDHLSTPPGVQSPLLAGPDLTYDALVWRKGRWILLENVDVADPELDGPWNAPKGRRRR